MSRKAQTGILSYFAILFFFIVFWAFYLADWLAGIGARAVVDNSLTGFEAFAFTYLNLWVFIGVLCAGAIGIYAAGGQQ